MTNPSPERFVPVIELAEVGLAACVVSFFNNPRKTKSPAARTIERHWTLDEHSPLLVAFIATAMIADTWANGEDLPRALFVGRLYCSLDGRPEQDFLAVAKRLLDRMEKGGSTVFTANKTVGGQRKYYVMTDDETAQYLIREAAKEHGSKLQEFADAVLEKFMQLEAFIQETDSFRAQWRSARVAA